MQLEIQSLDGTPLHARLNTTDTPAGTLVVAHGFGEHSGNYDRLIRELIARSLPLETLVFDFRGHGRSPGRRGVVSRYSELVDDLVAAVDWAANQHSGRPVYVLGHSNGGQVALRAAIEAPDRFAGLILSNPFLAHASPVPAWKLALGRVLHRFAPEITLGAGLDLRQMNRDEASWAERRADTLAHDRISAPLYFGMVEGGQEILRRAAEIRPPALFLLGAEDPVASVAAARQCFDRLGTADRTLHVYEGMLHEPLNELERGRVLDDLEAWLRPRLVPPLRAG